MAAAYSNAEWIAVATFTRTTLGNRDCMIIAVDRDFSIALVALTLAETSGANLIEAEAKAPKCL
jgi:hypothetical protein